LAAVGRGIGREEVECLGEVGQFVSLSTEVYETLMEMSRCGQWTEQHCGFLAERQKQFPIDF
jgi:hypothetical protein